MKLTPLLPLLLISAASAPAALISAWSLDESSGNVNSSVGSVPAGVPTGSPTYGLAGVPNGTYGAISVVDAAGSSIGFGPQAVDEFFTVGSNNQTAVQNLAPAGAFTVMAWINPEAPSITGTYRVVSTGTAATAGRGWGFGLNFSNVNGTGSAIRFTTYGIADNNSPLFNVTYGEWLHLAVTYNNGSINYFLNGNQMLTGRTSLFENEGTDALLVLGGRMGGADSDQTNGRLDGIRVYDNVLTAGEIATAAALSVSVPEPSALMFAALGLAGAVVRRRR